MPLIFARYVRPSVGVAGVNVTTCATPGKLVVLGVSVVNAVPAVLAVSVITLPATLVV